MRPPGLLVMSIAVTLMACSNPFPCTRYCWSHQQDVPDLTDEDMTGMPDGRFDDHCQRISDLKDWYPLLPPFGWYAAEQCVPADLHQIIEKTVASIQDPTLDASQACDVTELQAYADFVQTLALQARDACVAHLTCNGAPVGCDLDPMTIGPQACTVSTAQTLCDQVVLAPALAALTDLTNGPGAAQPQPDGTVLEYVDDPAECEPLLEADTDDTPACDEPPAPDGGVDEGSSGTTGEGAAPFGDIDALVTCTDPRRCAVEPELFAAVEQHLWVFADEGVSLELVDRPNIPRGYTLSGLDRGEASEHLLTALGLLEGDVITHVDGASLADSKTLERLVLELPTATSWALTLYRGKGTTGSTLSLAITRTP